MDAQAPSPPRALIPDALRIIHARLPCLVARRRMARICHSWRDAIKPQQPRPEETPLPWILVARDGGGGPSFSCALRGCRTHATRGFVVPSYARAARYRGGWLFLAIYQTMKHGMISLRTVQQLHIPDFVQILDRPDMRIVMAAATLSSPPKRESCVGAAIVYTIPMVTPPTQAFTRSGAWVRIRRSRGALTPPSSPVVRQIFRFSRNDYGENAVAVRYLVESRGNLLMVARLAPHPVPLSPPTSTFKVFEMVPPPPPGITPISNDGASSFAGSYDAAKFPWIGFNEGVYFLDDGRLHNEGAMFLNPQFRQYPCNDSGKWMGEAAVPCVDNFFPGRGPSNYSPPVWLFPRKCSNYFDPRGTVQNIEYYCTR
uniref:DUF295 domain-containing protein n=1 Tax=Leersia perrieri TaxID=77586 RepID=A0A0D9WHW2_9ORYZ